MGSNPPTWNNEVRPFRPNGSVTLAMIMTNPSETRYWQLPELADDDRVIAGVCGGIARELGASPNLVRLGFVILFATGGWGLLLYGVIWAAMTIMRERDQTIAQPRVPKARSASHRTFGFGLVVSGMALLSVQLGGFPPSLIFPLGLLGVGVLFSWSRISAHSTTGWATARRLTGAVVGLLLATVALIIIGSNLIGLGSLAESTLLAIGAVGSMIAVSAPWWWRLVRERDAERQARVRSEERAEVAAHLHDSVLQTLSLIQRHSDDPKAMLNLARRQERELRNWLDPNRVSRRGGSIRGQLDELATTVEELHGVPVEVVAVGDCLVDERLESLIAAAGEATVNAAKHSGADQIDLYLEVSDEAVEVFVRDTGKGFDMETIDDDRRGVRNSIVGRMERAGGTATIMTTPGDGTEVELFLARSTDEPGLPA